MGSFVEHLAGMLTFSGRETRRRFWPYAAGVLVVAALGLSLAMIPLMARTMGHMAAQGGNYGPDLGAFFIGVGIMTLGVVVLLAAAVTRRLHDSGRSGAWGLVPLPFQAAGIALAPRLLASGASDSLLFVGLFLNNLAYIALLMGLAIMLTAPGTVDANRFGPPALP